MDFLSRLSFFVMALPFAVRGRAVRTILCGALLLFSLIDAAPSLFLTESALDSKEKTQSEGLSRKAKDRPEIMRAKFIRADYGVLKDMRGEVAIDLFLGTRIVAKLKSVKNYTTLHEKHTQWVGVVLGDSTGRVSMSVWGDKYIFADISYQGQRYKIGPADDSFSLIMQYDSEKVPAFREPDDSETAPEQGKDGTDE